jgi:phosphopantothenoylcysteine decarboxylase / phosphopantothenate---cysteine ligase
VRVLLGVCGGVAAYKAAELLRALQDRGVDVEVALTASAERFITPLTFRALTGKRVYTSLWDTTEEVDPEGPIEHIAVAQAIDTLVIAPATAHTLARLAHGMADDFLTTVALATTAPVIVAPAMNVNMWQHAATRDNLERLRRRGVRVVEPDSGYLACGMTGSGRLAPLPSIVEAVLAAGSRRRDLAQETVLVTAGGTREPVDAVRFLGNRSSGRMGHALAEAAVARGSRVLLVTASGLPAPAGCEVLRVTTAEEMGNALEAHLPDATLVFGAAAVSDFRPAAPAAGKLRRSGRLTLELEGTPDLIAAAVAQRHTGSLVVAFAAEVDDLEHQAREKLLRKGADAIVANNVADPTIGFDSEQNAGLFVTPERTVPLARGPKTAMARDILELTLELRHARGLEHTGAGVLASAETAR